MPSFLHVLPLNMSGRRGDFVWHHIIPILSLIKFISEFIGIEINRIPFLFYLEAFPLMIEEFHMWCVIVCQFEEDDQIINELILRNIKLAAEPIRHDIVMILIEVIADPFRNQSIWLAYAIHFVVNNFEQMNPLLSISEY